MTNTSRLLTLLIITTMLLSDAAWAANKKIKQIKSTQSQSENYLQGTDQSALPRIAQAEPVKVKVKSFDWQGAIPDSRLVVLKNHYGSIRSRNNSDPKVFIHATYQEIGDSPLKPEFKISEKNDKLFIEVVYAEDVRDSSGQLRGRTDVSILFPDDVSIYAETDDGLIKIDKTSSHVQAISRSGPIKLTTTGLFSAKTETGEIGLRVRGFKEFGESNASSISGPIKVDVFNDMDVDLFASSDGDITLNNKLVKGGLIYQSGQQKLQLQLKSSSGKIDIQTVKPPELVRSVKPSKAHSVDVDLRNLPQSKSWKPGDPVYDRDDKKDNKDNKNRDKQSKE